MRRSEFLIGKVVFNAFLALAQATLTISLGVTLLGIPLRWDLLSLALAGVVVGTAGWFFFLSSFALRIRRNDMFNTFINVAYFVFMFASSMFYPVEALPRWLQIAAKLNPLTWHTNALRYATIGVGTFPDVVWEAGAFLLFLLGSFVFAVHTLRHGILR
jgi:ABC-2 type transport system permease protein